MLYTKRMKEWIALGLAFAVSLFALPVGARAGSDPTAANNIRVGARLAEEPKEFYELSGKPGDSIFLVIPVENVGADQLQKLTCTLTIASQTGTFPFSAAEGTKEMAAYAAKKWDAATKAPVDWTGDVLEAGEKAYFALKPTLLSSVTAGSKVLTFRVGYQLAGSDDPLYSDVMIWFTALSAGGDTPTEPVGGDPVVVPSGGGGSGYKSKPKVIVQSYSFDKEKVYAGETCKLAVRLRNTSSREAVKNLQFNFTNESGAVMPVSGGSNSFYIGELKKESATTLTIGLAIAPDAESKAQTLNLEITYEGTKNRQEFTEKSSITVPVTQKARVRCDTPVIYDEAWMGQSVNMSVQMFNLGKSTLYNCMVEVEGEGFSLEETYFGGNISSGSTLRADLSLKTAVAGDIDGTVRITYEDVYGEQSEQLLPFTLTVNEDMGGGTGADGMPATNGNASMEEFPGGAESPSGAGIPWYVWVILSALILVLAALLIIKLRRKRAAELEDE